MTDAPLFRVLRCGPGLTLAVLLVGLGLFELVPALAAIQPGETWHFQAWYRDAGSANNFTDAVSVMFF